MKQALYPSAALILLALAGCAATPATTAPAASQNETSTPTKTATPKATPTKTVDPRCLAVTPAMLQAIAEGAEPEGSITPVAGAAVKSEDFSNVYMIAMKFTAAGVGEQTGVWASGSLEPGGAVLLSVDGFAKNFTHWPDGGKSQFEVKQSDDGVSEATRCLK